MVEQKVTDALVAAARRQITTGEGVLALVGVGDTMALARYYLYGQASAINVVFLSFRKGFIGLVRLQISHASRHVGPTCMLDLCVTLCMASPCQGGPPVEHGQHRCPCACPVSLHHTCMACLSAGPVCPPDRMVATAGRRTCLCAGQEHQ